MRAKDIHSERRSPLAVAGETLLAGIGYSLVFLAATGALFGAVLASDHIRNYYGSEVLGIAAFIVTFVMGLSLIAAAWMAIGQWRQNRRQAAYEAEQALARAQRNDPGPPPWRVTL